MGYRVSNSSVYISKEVYQISRSELNGLELGRSSLSHSGADDNSKVVHLRPGGLKVEPSDGGFSDERVKNGQSFRTY
ncbi:MAG TPA: hypothetical protein VKJ45_00390 [Blastocatellia bacterium]|nr:hypothetical protein [Blastocatellia bacterium]